ncbi:MAG: AsmA-like C-terminal region-containing protein, partial [Bacteroidota bacterium]
IPVEAVLDIKSELIDIYELTSNESDSSGFNEQIRDLDLSFKFNSSARAITESPNLPIGEFFIEQLNFEMTNYPHQLKDFRADVLIDSVDFRVIDFSGLIDESDFHFNGKLANYDLWFKESPTGDTQIDFDLDADLLRLEDLFSYGGENYVPEDYRHEEFRKLHLHGNAYLEFDKKLASATLKIDEWEANMNVHDMRFEDFQGEFYMDSTKITVSDLGGKLGNSSFNTNLTYFRNAEPANQPHAFRLESDRLDFDQLFAYNSPPESEETVTIDHDAGFNIFELPFSDMNFDFQIDQLNYHRYLLDDFVLAGRMQGDHYIYVDTMAFVAAGGNMVLKGYFNGSDPSMIYFRPEVNVENIDLDKLLFKFENFGQDYLISENLHGQLSATLEGKIHMHADLVPSIDDSELNMNISVLNGSLNDFDVFEALSDYFTDKNLSQVRFDTLTNEFLVDNGVLTIPNMKMNTTLGYFEISGKQSITQEMEYYVRIPIKVIAKAGMQKLFGKKDTDTSDQVDEIQYRDETKRTRFLNLKITGTPDDYEIALGKDKSQ